MVCQCFQPHHLITYKLLFHFQCCQYHSLSNYNVYGPIFLPISPAAPLGKILSHGFVVLHCLLMITQKIWLPLRHYCNFWGIKCYIIHMTRVPQIVLTSRTHVLFLFHPLPLSLSLSLSLPLPPFLPPSLSQLSQKRMSYPCR